MVKPEFSFMQRCQIHDTVRVMPFTNLYDCEIGASSFIGPFVELGGVKIGERTIISSHSYACPGVEIGNDCFIAHGVFFTNDKFSDVPTYQSIPELKKLWNMRHTVVGNRVRIGSGAVILPVTLGDGCIIGAGAVITKDVPAGAVVTGVPGRVRYFIKP